MLSVILSIVLAANISLINASLWHKSFSIKSDVSVSSSVVLPAVATGLNESCLICEFLSKTLPQYRTENATHSEIDKLLKFVCKKELPEHLREKCSQFVEQYGFQIGQNIGSEKVCQSISVCSVESEQQLRFEPIQSKPICELCNLVLLTAKELLDSNQTDDEILKFIQNDFCGKLGSLNETCVDYVHIYGKIILYQLSLDIDPWIICQRLSLCATGVRSIRPISKQHDSKNCNLCEFVASQVEAFLQSNDTDKEILEYISDIMCLPMGIMAPTCKALVDKYGPFFINKLAKKVEPTKLCQEIGFCSNTINDLIRDQRVLEYKKLARQIQPKEPIIAKTFNDPVCVICEYAVKYLNYELRKNKTQEAIEKALEKVCRLVPSRASRIQCETVISTYGGYMTELILEFDDPALVCQTIKLCQKQKLNALLFIFKSSSVRRQLF